MKFKERDLVRVDLGGDITRIGRIDTFDPEDHQYPFAIDFPKRLEEDDFSKDCGWYSKWDVKEIKNGLNVYLAGPFFSDLQIEVVQNLRKALTENETIGNIFVPMEHQMNDGELEEFTAPWAREVAKNDYKHVLEADIVVAIVDFDGQDMDSGTAVEIGYAYALGKPVFLYHQECHDIMVNLMATEIAQAYFTDAQQVKEYDFKEMKHIPFTGNYR